MLLVDRVVPPEQLLDEALGLAAELAANPGPQLLMVKETRQSARSWSAEPRTSDRPTER